MTPRAKAKELVEKIDVVHKFKLNNGKVLPVSMHRSQMVGCAIIAVEEIVELDVTWIRQSIADDYPKTYSQDQTKEYWYQVLNILKSMQS